MAALQHAFGHHAGRVLRRYVAVGLVLALAGQPQAADKAAKEKQRSKPRGPVIGIVVRHPGMPAVVMERDIMSRLQRWTGQSVGIEHQQGKAVRGVCVIKNFFRPGVPRDTAMKQVASIAASDLFFLPPGTIPPEIIPLDPSASVPVGLMGLLAKGQPRTPAETKDQEQELHQLAYQHVRRRLQLVPGVLSPTVYGGRQRRIAVHLDRDKLTVYGLSLTDVHNAIRKVNTRVPGGGIKKDIVVRTKLDSMESISKIVLAVRNSAPVLLRDVGETRVEAAPAATAARLNGQRAVCLPIWSVPAAKRSDVQAGVSKALDSIRSKVPAGHRLEWHALGSTKRPDARLLTIFVRTAAGTKLDASQKAIVQVERLIAKEIPPDDRRVIFSQLGINADLSALFSRHSAPEDATIRIQLTDAADETRKYASRLRGLLTKTLPGLQFSFHVGLSTDPPLMIRLTGPSLEQLHKLAAKVRDGVSRVAGAVDVQIAERMPTLAKAQRPQPKAPRDAAKTGDVNRVFWIDPATGAHYFMGIHPAGKKEPEDSRQGEPVVEISHFNLTRAVHIRINVDGHPVAGVAVDVQKMLKMLEVPQGIDVELTSQAP